MSDKSTPVYTLIHTHEYGMSIYKFASDTPKPIGTWHAEMNLEKIYSILQALEIDFEPEKGETITIELDDQVATYIP